MKVAPDPVLIASEAALWGAIRRQGLLPDTVIVSDDAGQSRLLQPEDVAERHSSRRGRLWTCPPRRIRCLRPIAHALPRTAADREAG